MELLFVWLNRWKNPHLQLGNFPYQSTGMGRVVPSSGTNLSIHLQSLCSVHNEWSKFRNGVSRDQNDVTSRCMWSMPGETCDECLAMPVMVSLETFDGCSRDRWRCLSKPDSALRDQAMTLLTDNLKYNYHQCAINNDFHFNETSVPIVLLHFYISKSCSLHHSSLGLNVRGGLCVNTNGVPVNTMQFQFMFAFVNSFFPINAVSTAGSRKMLHTYAKVVLSGQVPLKIVSSCWKSLFIEPLLGHHRR